MLVKCSQNIFLLAGTVLVTEFPAIQAPIMINLSNSHLFLRIFSLPYWSKIYINGTIIHVTEHGSNQVFSYRGSICICDVYTFTYSGLQTKVYIPQTNVLHHFYHIPQTLPASFSPALYKTCHCDSSLIYLCKSRQVGFVTFCSPQKFIIAQQEPAPMPTCISGNNSYWTGVSSFILLSIIHSSRHNNVQSRLVFKKPPCSTM